MNQQAYTQYNFSAVVAKFDTLDDSILVIDVVSNLVVFLYHLLLLPNIWWDNGVVKTLNVVMVILDLGLIAGPAPFVCSGAAGADSRCKFYMIIAANVAIASWIALYQVRKQKKCVVADAEAGGAALASSASRAEDVPMKTLA